MDLDKISAMKMLETKMKYTSAKQDVLSQNIASANIPNYKRQDIAKPDFNSMVKSSMAMATTDPKHISGVNSSSSFKSYETNDKVEIDMEAIELLKNGQQSASAATTYKKMLTLIKEAIGNN